MRRIVAEKRIPAASWKAKLTAYLREEEVAVEKLFGNIRLLREGQQRLAYHPVSEALDKALLETLNVTEAGDLAEVDRACHQLSAKMCELEEVAKSRMGGMSFQDESRKEEAKALLKRLKERKQQF
jgi:hypothetical protein